MTPFVHQLVKGAIYDWIWEPFFESHDDAKERWARCGERSKQVGLGRWEAA
jgi:hypothetical protein